ncbi:MAG TPA: hypothetical protein VLE97_08760 [Gaiellaceae bacterium]|nr:hypothetical protein [Gaiellaceae bacterium]
MAKPTTYEVTLRRDVQQVTRVRVQAYSPKEAIAVAESATDEEAWNTEEQIGVHRPRVRRLRNLPIRGRETGKTDRRAGTDRRFDKRRLGDKSRALVDARNKPA